MMFYPVARKHCSCPFRKSYPRVAMMQSTQDGHSNDGTRPSAAYPQIRFYSGRIIMTLRFGPNTASVVGLLCFCLSTLIIQPGAAQTTPGAQISWEVANRFRLFAEQKDFDLQVNSSAGTSILEAEHTLEKTFEGRGWASSVGRLCYDRATGELPRTCVRDNQRQSYLKPDTHLIKLKVTLPPQFSAAQCTWTIGETPGSKSFTRPCSETVTDLRWMIRQRPEGSFRRVAHARWLP